MLIVFGKWIMGNGWTQQYHYGAIRNNNTKMFKLCWDLIPVSTLSVSSPQPKRWPNSSTA